MGSAGKALEELNKRVEEFLKIYDEDGNKEIDIDELKEKRVNLAQDLDKEEREINENDGSKIRGIVKNIKKLEEAISEYRREQLEQQEKTTEIDLDKSKKKLESELVEHHTIDLDKHLEEKENIEQQAQIVVIPSSSK